MDQGPQKTQLSPDHFAYSELRIQLLVHGCYWQMERTTAEKALESYEASKPKAGRRPISLPFGCSALASRPSTRSRVRPGLTRVAWHWLPFAEAEDQFLRGSVWPVPTDVGAGCGQCRDSQGKAGFRLRETLVVSENPLTGHSS